MRFHSSCLALAGLTALAVAPAHAQGLNNQPVDVSFLVSPMGPTGPPTFTGDYGTQTISPAGESFNGLADYGLFFSTLVTPTQIRFTLPLPAGSVAIFNKPSGYFQGFRIAETGGSPVAITGFVVDPATNVSGFGLSRVSGDPTDIFANFQGLTFDAGQNVTLDIVSAPVPEAATTVSLGLLLALGMGGLVVAKRKKASSSL